MRPTEKPPVHCERALTLRSWSDREIDQHVAAEDDVELAERKDCSIRFCLKVTWLQALGDPPVVVLLREVVHQHLDQCHAALRTA
jgi:hypothetical protein